MLESSANKPDSANPAMTLQFHIGRYWRRVADLERSLRHEVAFNTAWLDWFPDQALRVAAGIPGKHASGGLWPSGHYCQRYGAFPAM